MLQRTITVLKDSELIELINKEDSSGFKLLYDKYYTWLCRNAYTILKEQSDIEDVVQEVFIELWKKRDVLKVEVSLKYYLRRSVINRSINHVKRESKKHDSIDGYNEVVSKNISVQAKIEHNELKDRIQIAIDTLPTKRKEIFIMSRYDDLTYKEIAAKKGISIKTVENQISSALKSLRALLK